MNKSGLEIEIKSFGPIDTGKIKLKPLTIFIGPNNSGKSFAAMLIHSIYESYSPMLPGRIRLFSKRPYYRIDIGRQYLHKKLIPIINEIKNLQDGEEFVIPQQIINDVCTDISKVTYEKALNREIIRSFACRLQELVRIGNNSFRLKIKYNSCNIDLESQKNVLKAIKYPQIDFKILIKMTKSLKPILRVTESKNKAKIEIGTLLFETEQRRIPPQYRIADIISELCVSRILGSVRAICYYLPAARSGILQAHKNLAALIIQRSPYAGIEKFEISKFSGVVSDFIASIISLPEERGPFYKLAHDFEKELIKGEVRVKFPEENVYPEIEYKFSNTAIPLSRASSTVSELAPLFLYLKYSISPDNILIIEEPEAHLHPGNQRILTKYLVRLIRKGVRIIITTHSDFLIEQLNNFIKLSKIEPKKRPSRYKYSEEDYLKPEEVAPYVFKPDRANGHKISKLRITEEDGISQREFLRIYEALYEETFKIDKDLINKK